MKYEILTLKYSTKETWAYLLVIIILFIVITSFFYILFNNALEILLASGISVILSSIFLYFFNKNAVLKISNINDVPKLKELLSEIIIKKGFILVYSYSFETKYDRKSRINRWLNKIFLDFVIVKEENDELNLYSKKQTLVSLQMRVKKTFSCE